MCVWGGGGGGSFNSPGWHMNTCHCLKVCCVSQQSEEHGGDSSWQAVTLRELDRAIEGLNPSVGLVYTLYRMSMPRAMELQQAAGVNVSDQTDNFMRVA